MPTFSRFSRYFLEVARQGSIRKASETLHVSASAVDRQILNAEDELGVKLFERLPSGLRLTAAGELLLGNVRQWDKGLHRLREQFDELQGLRRGHVEIGLIDALGEGLLPQTLAGLLNEHPNLTFGLHSADNREVIGQVIRGDVDMGLLLDPVAGIDLHVRAFAEVPLGLAVPPGHALLERSKVQLADALEHRLILPSLPLIVAEHGQALIAREGIDTQRLLQCNDVRLMRALVREGAGVALLSWLDVAEDLRHGRLAFIPLRHRLAKPLMLTLCVAPQRQLSRAAQTVLQALAQGVGALSPSRAEL